MAKRISELPAATEVADVDELELNQGGASRKATRAQLVTGLAPAAHTHSLAEITDSGALAGKDSVASEDIGAGAVTAQQLFGGTAGAPAAVDGVVTITPADDRLLYSVTDGATTTIKVETPAARRPVLLLNATGNTVDVVDQADGNIRASVPNRHTVWLDWTGTDWQFGVEWSQRLHQHTLGDVTDSGTAASRDVPATGDAAASEVVLGDDSRLADARQPLAHTHDAGDIDSGTLADARIAESSVKQHEAALSIMEGQISDLAHDAVALRGVSLDASVGTPSDGDLLVYRTAGDDWVLEPKPAGGSNPALNDVTDVTISAPADNELLAFDAGSGEWINQTPAEAGLAEASHTHSLADVTDSGALAAKNTVATADLDDAAVTPAKLDRTYSEPGHTHTLAQVTDSGTLAAADDAAGVPFTPAGNIAAADVQTAIEELDAEKAAVAHTHNLADVTDSGALAAKDTVATADLDDDAVNLAKVAHGTPDVLLGFDGSGAPAEITVGQGIGVLGTVIEADVASVFGRTGTVTAQTGDYDGLPLDLQDAPLTRAKFRDYSETTSTPLISSGALTFDLEAGNAFDVVLTEDVTSISIVNAPATGSLGTLTVRFRQDATGGRTVDLSGFDFGSAAPPAMPSTATSGRLWITALTLDGGAVWEAMAGFEKA